jgi:acetyltransferase-like isoleucine patch superfamily enzyme
LNNKVRIFFIKLLKPIIKIIAVIFFDKKYIQGKYFDVQNIGWKWVIHALWYQKILRFNAKAPFPISPTTRILNYKNIIFHPDDLNNMQSPGCYFQNFEAKIIIGKGSYIAPNVGIITANHDPRNLDKHLEGRDVVIGAQCWLGMNSIILPGVILGDRVIVAAGSVVSKSFKKGNCLLGGVPAKIIKYY